MAEMPIEMQYNFPLLPGQPAQWRERLASAVAGLSDDNYDELRPTFRGDTSTLIASAARWMNTPPECTYLTEGNHQGSLLAFMASGITGKPIAVDVAAYTGAVEQARAFGCPLLAVDVDAEGMVPASLRSHCEQARAAGVPVAAIYVIPTVHNPLGCVASLTRREELLAVARDFHLLIFEDAAYEYMAPDAPASFGQLAPERTFYIRGISKSYAPGARTGFMTAPAQFADRMWVAIKNAATGVNLVHARAAISLIEDGTLDRIIVEKIIEGTARNAAARALLPAGSCRPGAPAAWHLWVHLPPTTMPQAFEARMASRGILISGGNWFAASATTAMPNGFRIALGGEVDRARCLEGVRLIGEELCGL